jgi:hypothetical protein
LRDDLIWDLRFSLLHYFAISLFPSYSIGC